MRILVTGSAGFIGSHVVMKLLERGDIVLGVDNHNDYYDPAIKEARIQRFIKHPHYQHLRIDLADKIAIDDAFDKFRPQRVINLAAQAGVRHSINNPLLYINSNILGFANLLESCKFNNIEHLVYASSSSVYGANTCQPFSIHQNVNHPLNLYAASKKSNELMAHAYSHLYALPTTGLRFFTVYGPWGRPDMALFKFTKAILSGEKIQIYNYGNHRRDFTFIDDITEGIIKVLDNPAQRNNTWNGNNPDPGSSSAPWRLYNLGNNQPISLLDYIAVLENKLGITAEKEFLPLQQGDAPETYAEIEDLVNDFSFSPSTSIEEGIFKFVSWYKDYFQVKV
jgi:UDP-glucuronate 4-epimerase